MKLEEETEADSEKKFEQKMLEEINTARTNPKEYAKKIKEMMSYIKNENDLCYLIIDNKNKIKLEKGRGIFFETIDFLNSIQPVSKLAWNPELKVDFSEYMERNNKTFISNSDLQSLILTKRAELKRKNCNCVFTLDFFSNPVLSIVFQITDEAFHKDRRKTIFNPKLTQYSVGFFLDPKRNFISLSSFI